MLKIGIESSLKEDKTLRVFLDFFLPLRPFKLLAELSHLLDKLNPHLDDDTLFHEHG